ncbi:MAG: GNAT family N-acetyltransferase [Ruminococcus sp.]|nr:GNAT family N-acetyltransferase [Ruminococcus sp.]
MSDLTLDCLSVSQAKEIYKKYMKSDFPKNELKPFSMIKVHTERGVYLPIGIYDNNALAGYAYCLLDKESSGVLLDYFAILKPLRGKGIGSRALKSVCSYFTNELGFKALVLESESADFAKNDEDKATRLKRMAFYQRNGMFLQSFSTNLFGVHYKIFSYPEVDARGLILSIYQKILPARLLKSRLKIIEEE